MTGMTGAAEAVVVALAANGNATAFDELVRRKQSSVRTLLRSLCWDAGTAEDLAQQVFVEVWKSLGRLDAIGAFNGWLRRIAVNVWLQHARKKDTSLRRLTDSLEVNPVELVEHPSHGRDIDLTKALELLPGPVRLCIVLAYQEDMSHGDIATTTGIPLGTVKSHISRGSTRLRQLLSDYGTST